MILHFKFVSPRSNCKHPAMRFLILLCLTWSASCDKLTKPAYLPRDAAAAGGAGAGLQAPHAGPAQAAAPPPAAYILSYENDISEEGYHYAYETSDGTKAEQTGHVIPGAGDDAGSLRVSGSYSYVGPDGRRYAVSYTADERGYIASGAHLPTPPPAPALALPAARSLQLTAAAGAHYDSKRSSYDADAGY